MLLAGISDSSSLGPWPCSVCLSALELSERAGESQPASGGAFAGKLFES